MQASNQKDSFSVILSFFFLYQHNLHCLPEIYLCSIGILWFSTSSGIIFFFSWWITFKNTIYFTMPSIYEKRVEQSNPLNILCISDYALRNFTIVCLFSLSFLLSKLVFIHVCVSKNCLGFVFLFVPVFSFYLSISAFVFIISSIFLKILLLLSWINEYVRYTYR